MLLSSRLWLLQLWLPTARGVTYLHLKDGKQNSNHKMFLNAHPQFNSNQNPRSFWLCLRVLLQRSSVQPRLWTRSIMDALKSWNTITPCNVKCCFAPWMSLHHAVPIAAWNTSAYYWDCSMLWAVVVLIANAKSLLLRKHSGFNGGKAFNTSHSCENIKFSILGPYHVTVFLL